MKNRFCIVPSFAPSAAAGWHGERPRIPYARNGVWHSVFSSVGPCRRFSNQNCVRNKTACADFPTQNRWKTQRDAGLFLHIFGVKINSFFFDFGVIFLPEGTPGASWVALESPWAPKIEFWSILDWFWDPSWIQVGPNLEALGRLSASWGGLLAVLSPFIYDPISKSFSDFILHRFRTPERPQNHSKIN